MKKRVKLISLLWFAFAILFFALFTLNGVYAQSTSTSSSSSSGYNEEIKKITHYAEEYETGNINYPRLVIYLGTLRDKLNDKLGAVDFEGGVLREEQVKKVFGEPKMYTRWVWVEKENREKKLDKDIPVWDKIVFDGKKIQIRLNAYPSIFVKKSSFDKNNRESERVDKEMEEELGEEKLIYHLNFQTIFKRPSESFDLDGKIDEIQELALVFDSTPSDENAEALAKASVSAEKSFQSYFMQNDAECIPTMEDIFGAENLVETSKIYSQQISLYSGDDFDANLNLEMCEDCKWNWINLNIWIDSRGKYKGPQMQGPSDGSEFKGLSSEQYQEKTRKFVEDLILELEEKDFNQAVQTGMKLMALTQEWNQVANDVWKEAEEKFSDKGLSEEERRKIGENYGWIKREQEKRRYVEELGQTNFEKRKAFYKELFSGYDARESYYEETRFEKRLLESFSSSGRETCDNNQDDNNDGQIDCSDSTCGGQLCGKSFESILGENNETTQVEKMLYCIQGMCQAKSEEIALKLLSVCGNNICEEGENLNCISDCAVCPVFEALNCNGKIIFGGQDANGCPLSPVCLEEKISCETKEDCANPLCGEADCVEGACKVVTLNECRESECGEGVKRVTTCSSGEKIIEAVCENGIWREIVSETRCTGEVIGVAEEEKDVISYECNVRNDCGGENDVCSNGRCVSLPEVIIDEDKERETETEFPEGEVTGGEEQETGEGSGESEEGGETGGQEESSGVVEEQEGPPQEEEAVPEEESSASESVSPVEVTGEFILNFFRGILKITGLVGEEGGEVIIDDGGGDAPQEEPGPGPPTEPPNGEGEFPQVDEGEREGPGGDERNWEDDREEREEEESERREKECEERCSRECYDRTVRPCVDQCIWKDCGEELDCDIDDITQGCEEQCKGDNLEGCQSECKSKCLKGENTWKEPERGEEQKMNTGGFQAGGSCRTEKGTMNGGIWFGGWGENFEKIERLKRKYQMGGGDDEWCKREYESLVKQRAELEKGLNEEFAVWFFEEHLANSADEWENLVSGIYELYWKDVDTIREMTFRKECANIPEDPKYKLINFKYKSEYGEIEFWEEIKEVDLKKMDKEGEGGKVEMITPYMRLWLFPSKEFMKYEMKKAMENHEFPGKEGNIERENEEGLTEEEKMRVRENEAFMRIISEISEKYNGNFDGVAQIKDFETDEIIFNMKVVVNEEDLISMEPMPYSEVTEEDARVEIDFEKVYDFIYTQEKEMRQTRVESPPWAPRVDLIQSINEFANGIKSFFKIRSLIGSSKVYPESARGDIEKLFNAFMNLMSKGEDRMNQGMQEPEEGEGEGEGETGGGESQGSGFVIRTY